MTVALRATGRRNAFRYALALSSGQCRLPVRATHGRRAGREHRKKQRTLPVNAMHEFNAQAKNKFNSPTHPQMKKLVFLLFGLCLYCFTACDSDHEPTKPVRPFNGDTLAQIAWNFPYIVEEHYHSISGIVPEGTTYRVPVIPRSVEDRTKKEYNEQDVDKVAHLVFRATVHGDTINRHKKEFETLARQLHALTLPTVGTSPVLCGVKSIKAVGVAENGRTYDLSWEMKLRIRDYKSRRKYDSGRIVTLECEDTESLTARYVVQLGQIRKAELAEHIQPELKFYLPVKRCMDFSSIRFDITLFNGEVLSFQHKLPSKSVLQELPNNSVLENYKQYGFEREATYFTTLWPVPEKEIGR